MADRYQSKKLWHGRTKSLRQYHAWVENDGTTTPPTLETIKVDSVPTRNGVAWLFVFNSYDKSTARSLADELARTMKGTLVRLYGTGKRR